jgi:hypothetical protein
LLPSLSPSGRVLARIFLMAVAPNELHIRTDPDVDWTPVLVHNSPTDASCGKDTNVKLTRKRLRLPRKVCLEA